jgi:hypothetical protein
LSRLAATAEKAIATSGGGHSETVAMAPKVMSFISDSCARMGLFPPIGTRKQENAK